MSYNDCINYKYLIHSTIDFAAAFCCPVCNKGTLVVGVDLLRFEKVSNLFALDIEIRGCSDSVIQWNRFVEAVQETGVNLK